MDFSKDSPGSAPAVPASVEPTPDAKAASPRTRPGGSRRRDKVQLSCDVCRRRKYAYMLVLVPRYVVLIAYRVDCAAIASSRVPRAPPEIRVAPTPTMPSLSLPWSLACTSAFSSWNVWSCL